MGMKVRLDRLRGRTVIFVHPGIGGPVDGSKLDAWSAVPGARGCTPQACAFRDALSAFAPHSAGIFGLSTQAVAVQRAHAAELRLPYPLLSDAALRVGDALGLPTFDFDGETYYERLTLITNDDEIEAALYPVDPPGDAPRQALAWLARRGGLPVTFVLHMSSL
jgi:peroxiredoxin